MSTRPRISFDEKGWCNAWQGMEEKKPWFFKPEEFDEAMEKRDREYVRRLKVLYPDL